MSTVHFVSMNVCVRHACSTYRGQKVLHFLGTGLTGGDEPLCGCWELNPHLLEEQFVLLTTEPSLYPQVQLLMTFWSDFMVVVVRLNTTFVLYLAYIT